MELRSHTRRHESRCRHHRWREPFSNEVVHVVHRCGERRPPGILLLLSLPFFLDVGPAVTMV